MNTTITLSALALLLSGNVIAQNYTLDPGNEITENIDVNVYSSVEINMPHTEVTSDAVELNWELIEVQANADWEYSYCDYTTCYDGSFTSGTMVSFNPGQAGFLKVNVVAGSEGYGMFRFRVYETGFESEADTLTYHFNSTLSLQDYYLSNSPQISINPLNSSIAINNSLDNSAFKIYGSNGQLIKQEVLSIGTNTYSTEGLKAGIYFISFTADGNAYYTEKIMLQ